MAAIELGNLLPYGSLDMYETGIMMLVTSPFSFIEAVGKTPSETTQGLINNLFVPSAMMLFAMLYNINLSRRLRRFVSVPSIFGASVIGTYIVADVVWKVTPLPSTGTSIIGFCFCTALSCTAFADLYESRRRKGDRGPGMKEFVKFLATSIMGTLGLVVGFYGYLWQNPSWMIHLTGGGLALTSLLLWTELGTPPVRRLPRALLGESARAILFVVITLTVVLLV